MPPEERADWTPAVSEPEEEFFGRLFAKVQAGDRNAAAELFVRYAPIIRARVRHQISPRMRSVFDSQDLMSTMARRLDRYVAVGRFKCDSVPQLLVLLGRIAEASVVDKARSESRLRRALEIGGADARLVACLAPEVRAEHDRFSDAWSDRLLDRLERALGMLSHDERELVVFWLSDLSFVEMGAALGVSPNASRKRWNALREKLIELLSAGEA